MKKKIARAVLVMAVLFVCVLGMLFWESYPIWYNFQYARNTDFFLEVHEPKVELLSGIFSGMSLSELKEYLGEKAQLIEIKSEKIAGIKDVRNYDTVNIDGYKHLEIEGKLKVHLYNNRVGEVTFYPSEYISYGTRLQNLLNKKINFDELKDRHFLKKDGSYRIVLVLNGNAHAFLFLDKRYSDEEDVWISSNF